jgi:hypothetical protein
LTCPVASIRILSGLISLLLARCLRLLGDGERGTHRWMKPRL